MSWERQRGALGCGYRDFSGSLPRWIFAREYCPCTRVMGISLDVYVSCICVWDTFRGDKS